MSWGFIHVGCCHFLDDAAGDLEAVMFRPHNTEFGGKAMLKDKGYFMVMVNVYWGLT